MWWNGPEFLQQKENEWSPIQTRQSIDESALKELVKQQPEVTHSLVNSEENPSEADLNNIIDCDRFSDLTRLLRITAYVLRFVNNLKQRSQSPRTRKKRIKELTAEEISSAETLWIKSVQAKSFPEEIKFNKGKQSSQPNKVGLLGLYLDDQQVLRSKGRINNARIEESSKNPALLPSRHHFVDLIIKYVHECVKHSGIRDTLTTIRERMWILCGREAAKRSLRHCVLCRRLEGVPFHAPPTPYLPTTRVSDDPPFTHTGLDFAGPLFIGHNEFSSNNDSTKVYVCLFTCASTRAVHLELTPRLTTEAFLRSFRRFASRRGLPVTLISDNAKTFKSACKDIRKITRSEEVLRYLTNNRITWTFICHCANRSRRNCKCKTHHLRI